VTRLVLCRHADPGSPDAPAGLAQILRRVPFAAVYTSPLERAVATAKAIAEGRNLAPALVDDLREIDRGAVDGLAFEEYPSKLQEALLRDCRGCATVHVNEQLFRLSAFPGDREALLREAQEQNAPEHVLADLRRLPADVEFGTVHELWAALTGTDPGDPLSVRIRCLTPKVVARVAAGARRMTSWHPEGLPENPIEMLRERPDDGDDPDDGGLAGVREPRRPKPGP